MATSAIAFRRSTAISVAALVMTVALLSVATWAPYLLFALLVPLAVAVWAWRSGTDAAPDGLTVIALLGGAGSRGQRSPDLPAPRGAGWRPG